MRVLVYGVLLVMLIGSGGCAMYQAKNIDEWISQAKQLDGSGCLYVRGNARPYADVSMLAVSTYGKNAPKWDACLDKIPPEARSLLP
jgi:hypothetical protein